MTTVNPRSFMGRTGPAVSLNADASSVPPGLLAALLCTLAVNPQRVGFIVQNQSVAPVQVVFDDGNSSTPTILLLNAYAAAGAAGGSIDMSTFPHYGRIRVYGAAGASVAAMDC